MNLYTLIEVLGICVCVEFEGEEVSEKGLFIVS